MNPESRFTDRVLFVWFVLMATGLAALTLVAARDVFILAFVAILLAIALSYPVGWLSRRLPRVLALLITLIALSGFAVFFSRVAANRISEQAREVVHDLPRAQEQVKDWLSHLLHPNVPTPPQKPEPETLSTEAIESAFVKAFPAALSVLSGLGAVVFIIALASFLVMRSQDCLAGLRRLLPTGTHGSFDALFAKMNGELRKWLGGILVAMVLMGVFTTIGLLVIGIKAWLFLGFVTFLATFVPYAGAIASALLGLMFALAQSPTYLVRALAVYVAVHVIEGYIVEPIVMRKAVRINPALLLFWQALIGTLLGVAAVAVATPLLVCCQVAVDYGISNRSQRIGQCPGSKS